MPMNFDTIAFNGTVLYVGDYKFGNVRANREHAVVMLFDNDWRLSIIWGVYTYSSNRWSDEISRKYNSEATPYSEFTDEPAEVEIAALTPVEEELVEWPDGDTVQGHVTAIELLKLIAYMTEWPSNAEGFKPHAKWRLKE